MVSWRRIRAGIIISVLFSPFWAPYLIEFTAGGAKKAELGPHTIVTTAADSQSHHASVPDPVEHVQQVIARRARRIQRQHHPAHAPWHWPEVKALDASMLPLNGDDCDECRPGGASLLASTTTVLSYLPFILTFLVVALALYQKLYPSLAGESASIKANGFTRSTTHSRSTIKQISAITFASTLALTAVLALLILCEISNFVNPIARDRALQTTISLLLILLILAIPSLEIRSLITGTGSDYVGKSNSRIRIEWTLEAFFFSIWLLGFWWSGNFLPGQDTANPEGPPTTTSTIQSIGEGSLCRIGVIGISLMSTLSGFASASSIWHTFFARPRPVTETTLKRSATGLQSAQEMLTTKRQRLQTLQRKLSEPTTTSSLFQKAIGSLRPNPDSLEQQALRIEVTGLEDMVASLSTTHSALQARLDSQLAAATCHGALLRLLAHAFAAFCTYRIAATAFSFLRRALSASAPGPDPVDSILALLATHYDPNLDHALWARSISFLLSGIILLASFTSVMQTFHLFARFLPGLLNLLQANLPLVVAQVCATYVISAALMLRSMVPGGVVGEGLRGLGGGVGRMGWVDGWFEVWFLGGVAVTAAGVWVGRQVAAGEWEEGEGEGEKWV